MIEVLPLDEGAIERRAAAYERNDDYAVQVAPHLGASRSLAGKVLRTHGSLHKQTGRFTTGILLRGDFAADRIGNAWVADGLEISTTVRDCERRYFDPAQLGQPQDTFSLRVSAWQVANRAAGMRCEDGWHEEAYKVKGRNLAAFIRPAPVFNAQTMDDHIWNLAPGLEYRAHESHILSPIDMPQALRVQAEVDAVRGNHETFARMVGELSMPLAGVTQDKVIHALWQ
jgi:hypothetical protein